jgi:hypothetical protein
MSQMHGDAGSQVANGNAPQSICGSPAEPIPEQLGTSHVALPRTHHEEAEQPPRTQKEKPGEHRTTEKNPDQKLSQVMLPQPVIPMNRYKHQNHRARNGGGSRPQHWPPIEKGPRRGPQVNNLSTLRGSQAPEQGKHVPEVGLEPTHLSIPHFECGASANSATRARSTRSNNRRLTAKCDQRSHYQCADLLYMQIG